MASTQRIIPSTFDPSTLKGEASRSVSNKKLLSRYNLLAKKMQA